MKLLVAFALATGTLAGGLTEMKQLSEAGKPDDALAASERILAPGKFAKWREEATANPGWKRTLVEAADPLFAAVGLSDLSPLERASVHYARGVVLARAEKRGEAGEAFEKARALAGPGDLRLDSTYDLAWTALEEGETLRKEIPELGGTQPAAAMPPTPGAPAQGAPPGPDPLQLAKAAYLVARDRFVERLKADASDPDSRANVELAQKRLKELAEIEKQREEKKKQEQEKKDQEQKDKGKKDQDSKDKDSKNQDDAKDPKKDDKSQDPKKKDEQQQPDEQKQDQDKQKKDAKPDASKEQQLTKEEVMRLLDTLKDREEEGKRLLEMRKRASRARVKKDW